MSYKTILVFAAHPDDEMAMSGTMSKAAALGVRVVIVQSTNGSEGYPRPDMKDTIVAVRRKEADEADKVLGTERIHLGHDDMALTNNKPTFKQFIKVIRSVRPDAIFTHGPHDLHRDHLATSALSIEARWQAGQPVAAQLGESWKTPHLYFYKAVRGAEPDYEVDISGYAHKSAEARRTQVSQHTLFRKTVEDFDREIEAIKKSNERRTERFWNADVVLGYPTLSNENVPRPEWMIALR
ncbi:MAG: PIG-L family deacetylase [Planctomycetota bacterium]